MEPPIHLADPTPAALAARCSGALRRGAIVSHSCLLPAESQSTPLFPHSGASAWPSAARHKQHDERASRETTGNESAQRSTNRGEETHAPASPPSDKLTRFSFLRFGDSILFASAGLRSSPIEPQHHSTLQCTKRHPSIREGRTT